MSKVFPEDVVKASDWFEVTQDSVVGTTQELGDTTVLLPLPGGALSPDIIQFILRHFPLSKGQFPLVGPKKVKLFLSQVFTEFIAYSFICIVLVEAGLASSMKTPKVPVTVLLT